MRVPRSSLAMALALWAALATTALAGGHGPATDFSSYGWTEVNEHAAWTPRAGLQVLDHRNEFYLMGGRTPRPPSSPPIPGDSDIWGDVWKSTDRGQTWTRILETDDSSHWPARAYFKAVQKGPHMYIIGGQNFKLISNPNPFPGPNDPPFISVSDFFDDCWRSSDGVNWERLTDEAGWVGRAGLSAIEFKGMLWVMGGSFNDDPAVIGGPPTRVYLNDVWSSKDGRRWEETLESAPWAPRAGARLAVKDGYLFLFGGEDGFICLPSNPRCPPYFNDVWRTKDGKRWELVTESAEWPARPGHEVQVLNNRFILFGGFGLGADPTAPANPMDMWASKDGKHWEQFSDSPWNAMEPEEIKYDFATLIAPGGKGGQRPAIYTFGGDRETFDFMDPTNYLNVDNDVWRFALPTSATSGWERAGTTETRLLENTPNPFNPLTTIAFELAEPAAVSLQVYDVSGRLVRTLVDREMSASRHSVEWDGRNMNGALVSSGVYFYKLNAGEFSQVRKMVMVK